MKTTKGMRLTTVWKLCVEMWDWREYKRQGKTRQSATETKRDWCELKGYKLLQDCFFCDYAFLQAQKNGDEEYTKDDVPMIDCSYCPGRLIEKNFNCERQGMSWLDTSSWSFHTKLHRMYDKFLKERAK